MDTSFSDWLQEQMKERDWSQADLARASGLHRQVISSYINMRRPNPDPQALVALAHGLNLSPITVFRKARLLPPEGGEHASFEDWNYLLAQLPDEDQEMIGRLIEVQFEKRKKENTLRRLLPKKAK